MSAVWFYPSDNRPLGPTQRLGIYRGRMTTKTTEFNHPKTRTQDRASYLI